ncbi:hypothetical protein Hanom_Chr13g01206091 [Helianthus anomalus]
MMVKRPLEDDSEIENMAMANCLMLLSRVENSDSTLEPDRLFRCKTCNKPFQSFQALGGHCASYKRLKVNDGKDHRKKCSHDGEDGKWDDGFAFGFGTMGLCLDLGLFYI